MISEEPSTSKVLKWLGGLASSPVFRNTSMFSIGCGTTTYGKLLTTKFVAERTEFIHMSSKTASPPGRKS